MVICMRSCERGLAIAIAERKRLGILIPGIVCVLCTPRLGGKSLRGEEYFKILSLFAWQRGLRKESLRFRGFHHLLHCIRSTSFHLSSSVLLRPSVFSLQSSALPRPSTSRTVTLDYVVLFSSLRELRQAIVTERQPLPLPGQHSITMHNESE